MPLTEEHRSKLDSIVLQMEANKESPENIQFVVNDFKSKYDTATTTVEPPKPAGIMDYPGPMGINKLVKPVAKFAGRTILEQGPKALGAVIGGTLGAPLGPAGVIGGAGLGAAAVGGIEDIAHQTIGGQPRSSVGEAITNRLADVAGGAFQEAGPALKVASPGGVVTKQVENDLIRGIKPINRKTEFRGTLQRTVPAVASASKRTGQPIKTLSDLEPLIADSKKAVWAEFQSRLGPNAKTEIDGNQVADAMESVITKRFEMQNPGKAEAIRKVADTYRRDIPLDEAEEFLQGANNDLSAFYSKNKVGQRTAERDPDWGHVVKEAATLRKLLYDKLDEAAGPGTAEIKKRYGSLTSLEEEVLRRKNVAERQNPQSLAEQISMARAAGHAGKAVLTGDLVAGARAVAEPAAAMYLRHRNKTDTLVQRAFAEYNLGLSKKPMSDTLMRLLPILTRQAGSISQED